MSLQLQLLLLSIPTVFAINWQDAGNSGWALNCDFPGNDIGSVNVRGEDCGQKCSEKSGCTHFTWTNLKGGTCFFKKGVVNEANAKDKTTEAAVCGFTKSGSGGSGGNNVVGTASGKSTRYWDCCKVSCGWNGKAAVSAPVKSCAKNGVTGVDINAQSGCNGGSSFACNNNQPWEVNDQLAYGFAAAHLTRQQEKDWCCACYKLTFTNTAIAGKSMVVQVTNTGGDLGENHFDLMIPGGGVGIFNGCQSQFASPADGWGRRYGGVDNVGQCEQLPTEIRNGCKWRFNWFKNADNPTFNMQKVTCPKEIIAITGCKRSDE